VAAGRQAYVICPLVEESEVLEAKSAIKEYERTDDVGLAPRRHLRRDKAIGLLPLGARTPARDDWLPACR
jgi:hypothetical protein